MSTNTHLSTGSGSLPGPFTSTHLPKQRLLQRQVRSRRQYGTEIVIVSPQITEFTMGVTARLVSYRLVSKSLTFDDVIYYVGPGETRSQMSAPTTRQNTRTRRISGTVVRPLNECGGMTVRDAETGATYQCVEWETSELESIFTQIPAGATVPIRLRAVSGRGNCWRVVGVGTGQSMV